MNPQILVLARESRGISQVELAQRSAIAQGTLSKLERHELESSASQIRKFSKILNYPDALLRMSGSELPPFLSYRRKTKVPQKVLKQIDASINIYRLLIEKVLQGAPLNFTLPDVSTNPEQVASEVRKHLLMGEGPVDNMVQVLESLSIMVMSIDFNAIALDSRPILTQARQPIVVVNNQLLGDRLRYTLAFELGHILMHMSELHPGEDDVLRHRANLFAAEFLMPRQAIVQEFDQDVTIELLAQLKKKWKVSMQALLFRANTLGKITDNQKRYLLTQFQQRGIKKREPPELDVIIEKPALLAKHFHQFKTSDVDSKIISDVESVLSGVLL